MKIKKVVILIWCILLLLTSCNFDPYSDQRPSDYGDAIWVCEEYNIWFVVDTEKEGYYNPEGELQINDTSYFCKFFFIHQTNQLDISVYPLKYANVSDKSRDRNAVIGSIEGQCSFSDEYFVFTIEKITGEVDITAKELTFNKKQVPCE